VLLKGSWTALGLTDGVEMKITSGFDRKHERFYAIVLGAMAFASALILVLSIFLPQRLVGSNAEHVALAAFISLLVATTSYGSLVRFEHSFFLVGISGVSFALTMWVSGLASTLAILLACISAAGGILSLCLKGKFDKQVLGDDAE